MALGEIEAINELTQDTGFIYKTMPQYGSQGRYFTDRLYL